MHFSRSYSKNKVPYQVPLEERNTTFRAKIEHLNITKRYIKYTYSESTLDEQFKTLILSPEVTKFQALKRVPSTGTLLHLVKIGAHILANFSKTAERNGTRPISKQSLAQAGSNRKKSSKSVRSTTSYSKGTVPNDQKARVLWLQSQNWPSKPAKTLYKVYIFGIYVRRAIQNTNFVTWSNKIQSFKTGAGWCHPLLGLKRRASLLANFSKTAERNGTRPISKQSLAHAGSNKKNHRNRFTLQRVILK